MPNLTSLNALKVAQAASTLTRYYDDHWAFLTECVNTQDQTDKIVPIKPYLYYPHRGPYLEYMANAMRHETLLALVKHRRMLMTWTMCGLWLWDAMFHEGRFCALVSKKEEDSDELVKRCKFMYDNIPVDKLPVKPKLLYKYTEIRFPELDSVIKGVPSGADQLRQYTCSRVGCDEFGFWGRDTQKTYVATKPTIEGGGQVLLLSTRYPGFFQNVIEDTIDQFGD